MIKKETLKEKNKDLENLKVNQKDMSKNYNMLKMSFNNIKKILIEHLRKIKNLKMKYQKRQNKYPNLIEQYQVYK